MNLPTMQKMKSSENKSYPNEKAIIHMPLHPPMRQSFHKHKPVISISKSDKMKSTYSDRLKHWVYNTVKTTQSNYNAKISLKLSEQVFFKQRSKGDKDQ